MRGSARSWLLVRVLILVLLVALAVGNDAVPETVDASPPPPVSAPPSGGTPAEEADTLTAEAQGSRHSEGSATAAPELQSTVHQTVVGGETPNEAGQASGNALPHSDAGDGRTDGVAAKEKGDDLHASPSMSSPPDAAPSDGGFVIEEDESNHGLVEYSAPEDQAIDHLITMAGKGLSVVVSGAVVGIRHARMVVLRAVRRINRCVCTLTSTSACGVCVSVCIYCLCI